MTRRQLIELIRRQIYGGFPQDDAEITVGLVNKWLDISTAYAAQKNYIDNLKLEGISYINNGFYTTFKGLEASKDENFLWKITLPEIPPGIGQQEGISTIVFKDDTGKISYPVILMSMNQRSYGRDMRAIPNKLLGYQEGKNVFVLSTIKLSQYTATATMVSGGVSSDLDSEINTPQDYIPFIIEYIQKQLLFERNMPVDEKSDGVDSVKNV